MKTEPRERLEQWLRDAHAMEEQAESILMGQIERLESYPELRSRMELHLKETRAQGEQVRRCLQAIGVDNSAIKDLAGKATAFFQNFSGLFASDEVMKGALASYTFEHMEIASYRILVATAERAGQPEVARICRDILKEEEAMAEWLFEHLPALTESFLSRDQAEGVSAKR